MTYPRTAIWKYTPSRGYGYTFRVPVMVVGEWVHGYVIVITKVDGKLVRRNVKHSNIIFV